jgi:CelD/BcsL family acetyltransferase involved in cellulose biosynthesis
MMADIAWGREALEELRDEWAALWERCPELTPFQHPAWLIPWSRRFGGDEFITVTLRRGGRLVGLAPFFVHSNPEGGRDLLLLGTGNTDYLDLLVEPPIGEAGAGEMLRGALAVARCDACDLRQLRPGSHLRGVEAGVGWVAESLGDEPCPVLRLPTSPEELSTVVRSGFLTRIGRERRRLERRGRVVSEEVDGSDFDEAFDALVHLHQLRWTEAGHPGIFGDPAVVGFHREVARSFLENGWLRLRVLRFERRIIATQYAFTYRRRVYYYVGGFDPEFATWSPGTLIIAESIGAAIGEGAESFDFLRGAESYKYIWGASDTPTYRRRLERRDSIAGGGGPAQRWKSSREVDHAGS